MGQPAIRLHYFGGLLVAGLLAGCGGEPPLEEAPVRQVDDHISALAVACSGCHAAGNSEMRQLEGLSAETIAERLAVYQSEAAGGTVMHRLARGYSDSDIVEITAYYSEREAP